MRTITTESKSNTNLLAGIILILLNSWVNNAYAIGYALHDDSTLELQIAKDAPTRINLKGEKINDIFIHPQEAAEVVVHNSGCLFILPQAGNNKVYLTLIGENGTVQDLMLRFVAKSPAPIRLIKFDLAQDVIKTNLTNIQQEKKK